MRRRTFDFLLSSTGAVLAIVLIVAGALLFWGYSFANSNVRDQLVAQRINFPAKGSEALAPPEIGRYLNKYAGQRLENGAQAEAYANHFIAVHLKETAGGKTYAEVSTLARQSPNNTELAGQVQTLFRGETLRGLLLNAYAFWKIGQIAMFASIAAFALAAVMLIQTIFGFWHLRRASPTEEVLASTRSTRPSVSV